MSHTNKECGAYNQSYYRSQSGSYNNTQTTSEPQHFQQQHTLLASTQRVQIRLK